MEEAAKLVVGVVGVFVGLAIGFGGLVLVMQRTGGALFDSPLLGVAVAVGLVGGGAFIMGYLALWLAGVISNRRKDAKRAAKRREKR